MDALLKLGVIKESKATEWSQVHLVPKPTPEGAPQKWRFTLDFVRLNAATGGLEGWPIPNIQQIINRIGTLKPKVNYFRDHVPHMTEMVQPLRKLIDIKKYKGSKKLTWTPESIEAFHLCRIAVSNCQELYFLEDTATSILQTDASDYGIGGYMYMVTNGQVRVIRFFSKSLIGSQLNWSAGEKECYGIYYGVKLFEDLLDNRYFIL